MFRLISDFQVGAKALAHVLVRSGLLLTWQNCPSILFRLCQEKIVINPMLPHLKLKSSQNTIRQKLNREKS